MREKWERGMEKEARDIEREGYREREGERDG